MIDPKIIREYDIRGIYNVTLKDRDAFLVGYSFAIYLKETYSESSHIVSVCRDGRLSSPQIVKFLMAGLIKGGVVVHDIGIGPTPLLYFSNFASDVTAGIMVTGSHNPPEYNGFKFIVKKKAFFGEKIKEIFKISQRFHDLPVTEECSAREELSFLDLYINRVSRDYFPKSSKRIVWDCGNGAVGEVVNKLCKLLPGQHIILNEKIDGTFPAHHPDPTVIENLKELVERVIEEKADLGVAFDGDGDRIGVVDSKGRIVWGDQILLILSKDVLEKNPGASIIADVKASKVFFDEVTKSGGKALMWKTGHSHIKQKMVDVGSPLAGEMSGHIFIADNYYGFDDAIYAAIRLIAYLDRKNLSLSEVYDALPKVYNTTEIRVQCDDDKKFDVVEKLKRYFDEHKIVFNDIDGIRFDFPGGWGLIRASNTQDVLVCRFEASSKDDIKTQFFFVASLLKKYDLSMTEELLVINH
jgi:phosphomannomutase